MSGNWISDARSADGRWLLDGREVVHPDAHRGSRPWVTQEKVPARSGRGREAAYGPHLMSTAWTTIATAELEDADLVLQQRGTDFLIWYDGRVLMNSFSRGSEEQLSVLALAAIAPRDAPRILIGGLGMGFTLRAALDGLSAAGRVTVAELNQVIVDWCNGALAPATDHALADPRVTLVIADVAEVIAAAAPASLEAIILDLYEGPFDEVQGRTDPFYSAGAIARQRQALAPGGTLAVWAEASDPPYVARLEAEGFQVAVHPIESGDERHVVYVSRHAP